MKLAVSMYSYARTIRAGQMNHASFIHEARRIGADGVELLDYFYKDVAAERQAALAALAKTGLPCPIFSVAQDFAKAAPAERAAELEKIRFGMDEALHFGARVVRVFAGDVKPGVTFEQARQWIIEGLTAAANDAHARGLRLALENHGKLAGRGEQVRGLIDEVRQRCGHNALGANPDLGNFVLVNQPSHEAIAHVAGDAYMAHFKDFRPAEAAEQEHVYTALDGSRWVGTAVGEGQVQLERCIGVLREAGFDGWLSVEYEGEQDPLQAVPKSVANARRFL